jgi:hypothetical protein
LGHWVIAKLKQSLPYLPNQKDFAISAKVIIFIPKEIDGVPTRKHQVSNFGVLFLQVGNHKIRVSYTSDSCRRASHHAKLPQLLRGIWCSPWLPPASCGHFA